MSNLTGKDKEVAGHIELMLQYVKESDNSSELLQIISKLVTILVDSDHAYLSSARYSTQITFKGLVIGVKHNEDK